MKSGLWFVHVLRALALVVSTLVVVPIVVVVCLFEQDGKRGYRFAQWWMAFNLWMSGVRVKVSGLENLQPTRQYVFMSNHRSAADIVALGWALWAFQIRFVAKKELLKVPVFGWGLAALKNIVIDRSNQVQAVRSYAVAGQRIRRGISVVVFPEGTRGVGEELLPFKKGGFVLAMETGTPIAPIAVVGSTAIMAKHSWKIESGDVEVRIGTPIETAGVALKDKDQILARVREAIEALGRATAPQPLSQGSSSS
ncbi:MAG TPA: lysophospholipid acyltransferase family protein [Candidatus Binatia bacterium]|nr:lysophospholipid acyltransferase family protein [Candidatus Binatia bacterium]